VVGAVAVTLSAELLVQPRDDGGAALGWPSLAFDLFEHAVLLASGLVAVWLATRRIRPGDLGFRRVPWQAAFIDAVCLYVAYLLLTGLLVAVAGEPPRKSGAIALGHVDSIGLLAGFAVAVCVIAPLTEEVLFRGVVFSALRRRLAAAPAALVGGALFGVVHGPPLGSAIQLALLGIALCVLYDRTGSILPCVGLHSAYNAFAFATIVGLSFPATAGFVACAVAGSLGPALALADARHAAAGLDRTALDVRA
jgi:CAAX protease family protein